jgi:hypothetical protein
MQLHYPGTNDMVVALQINFALWGMIVCAVHKFIEVWS